MSELQYLSGFGNHFETEAEKGALPIGQNSPQKMPMGLYAEQLSGTAFTAPRRENKRSWLYRIRPSVLHGDFEAYRIDDWVSPPFEENYVSPNQFRWSALNYPDTYIDFIHSLTTWAAHGDPKQHTGAAIHLYCTNKSMENTFASNADGEMLIVPQQGRLTIKTEFGVMQVEPQEIAVIPRGVKFQVLLPDHKARGYVLENYGQLLQLPELGPIGANGLANGRDFQTPVAAYEEDDTSQQLIVKMHGVFWRAEIASSPLDVVAWHGNYAPYKYDLRRFNTINTVSYDHPDPSIFTVLTSPTGLSGVANMDFVIFPERWMVAEHTFRPPWYHRNIMSEFMGLITGSYDAKETGFMPGGCSLHNIMSAHGPDAEAFDKAVNQDLKPQFYGNTLAFMFESFNPWAPTQYAMTSDTLQSDYRACWQGLKKQFSK